MLPPPEFIQAHQRMSPDALGYRRGSLVKAGDRTCCAIAEWDSIERSRLRPLKMVASLVAVFRDTPETLERDPQHLRRCRCRGHPRIAAGPGLACLARRGRRESRFAEFQDGATAGR
jgi:hypothetical protein